MKKKKYLLPWLLFGTFVTLMIIATFFDLMISQGLYNAKSVFAGIVEHTAEVPIYFVFPYWLVIGVTLVLEKKWQKKGEFVNKKAFIMIGIIWSVFFMFAVGITSLCKICWGRVRFVDISLAENTFTSWYQLMGNTGNKSFFSGHAILSTIVFLPLFVIEGLTKPKKAIIMILGVAFVTAVAFGRIIGGQHYLSDVVVGIFMGVLLLYVTSFVVKKFSKAHYSLPKPAI